jgi:phosphate transport system protein
MIRLSVTALRTQDKDAAKRLYEMDDTVDALFRKYLRQSITPKGKKGSNKISSDPRCFASNLLTLRYLERMSDHACYIGDAVHYAVTGETSPRR